MITYDITYPVKYLPLSSVSSYDFNVLDCIFVANVNKMVKTVKIMIFMVFKDSALYTMSTWNFFRAYCHK